MINSTTDGQFSQP